MFRAPHPRSLFSPPSLLLAAAVANALSPPGAAQTRASIPAPDELAAAQAIVLETYPECGMNLNRERAAEVAGRMLDTAKATENRPAIRFAMMDYALQMAGHAGDSELVLRTIDRLGGAYRVDQVALAVQHLDRALTRAASTPARMAAVRNLVRTGEEAHGDGRSELAARAFDSAMTGARRLKDNHLRKAIERVQVGLVALRDDPSDPDGHHALGIYHCAFGDAWGRGVDHLTRTDDEPLRYCQELWIGESDQAATLMPSLNLTP